MLDEYSAQTVAIEVLSHLERRREAIIHDEALVSAEVERALVPVRRSYLDAELPASYLDALEAEVRATLPARWRTRALRFTEQEQRDFGVWRGGDIIARLCYVLIGLVIGGLIVAAPFIPIWEKWFPFLLSGLAWWLPSAQIALARRRYARSLGELAREIGAAQKQLDRHIRFDELMASAFPEADPEAPIAMANRSAADTDTEQPPKKG